MTADEEPKVGSKRSRDESGDDDAEKKAAKEEETKVTDDAAGKEAEPGKNDEGSDKKPDGETVKDDKPSTFGSASAGGGFGGFGGFGTSSTGGGFGGFSAGAGGGFGGFAKAASTEGGFPALSSVFGDANKPVQLFGKPAADAGDEDGDEGDEDAEGATDTYYKPVVKLQEEDVKTGEEEEECIFASEGALYEFVAEEGKGSTWKERGRGEMRINLGKNGGAHERVHLLNDVGRAHPHLEGEGGHLRVRAGHHVFAREAHPFPSLHLGERHVLPHRRVEYEPEVALGAHDHASPPVLAEVDAHLSSSIFCTAPCGQPVLVVNRLDRDGRRDGVKRGRRGRSASRGNQATRE